MTCEIIDIHCHLLCGVDDGPDSLKESVAALKRNAQEGIRTLILTPHYRRGMFETPLKEIKKRFRELYPYARKMGVTIYPGCEFHMDTEMILDICQETRYRLARSKYVLTEYSSMHSRQYIREHTNEVISCGYIPVIAHIERYPAVAEHPEAIRELSELGALIQLNADAVLGVDGKQMKKICHVLLKENLVDVIASDCHGIRYRPSHLAECCRYVERKYGEEAAERLFYRNPKKMVRMLEERKKKKCTHKRTV